MRYTTEVGICHDGEHEIDDAPAIENKGYKHPLRFDDKLREDSTGKAFHEKTYYRLCRAHYLEAFAVEYPNEALPAI